MTEANVWNRNAFPTRNLRTTPFPGARRKLARPFCWTPTEPFTFGGRHYLRLYPCIAFETRNFGFIIQCRWDGLTYGRE